MKKMTSKERVATTFARQEADRVPMDYLYNQGIDRKLKSHFGLALDDDEGLRQFLEIDFRNIVAPYRGAKLHPDIPGMKVDEFGRRTRWVEHPWGGYWDYCEWPLRYATEEEIAAWPMPSPDDYDYSFVDRMCEVYQDYYIVIGHPGVGDIINTAGMLRTMEQVLVDLITDDPAGLLLIDRNHEIWLEIIRRTLQAGRGRIDMLWLGEDIGTQRGPTISLELFRKHIRPRHQQFIDLAREWDIPVMMHSCGSCSWAFDDYIEMGITVVDTLQPEAKDMNPRDIKQRYGNKLAFHGMISTAGPLANGTVQDVIDNVREILEIMMPGGGYALSPTHQIQDNSPVENVLAMYEAAKKYGRYS